MTRITLLLSVLVLFGCGPKQETVHPTVGPITESVYASGIVKAAGQYTVYPTVSGTVLALLVEKGDTVKAGQPLLRLDDRTSGPAERTALAQLRTLEVNAAENGPVLAQLRDALDQAREKLKLDSANFARQRELWSQRIGSQADFEQRELAYTTSRAAFKRATSAVEETRNRLRSDLEAARSNASASGAGNADRTPRSLIDGVVYDLLIEPGELAVPQKAIAVIGSATDLYLELDVDEMDINQVKLGQRVLVTMDSYSDRVFEAQVTRIVPIMDERSRTVRVEAHFVNMPPRLFPNLTAEASIVLRTKEKALTIPAAYVVDDREVLVAPDKRVPVKLGARDLEQVEILDGIDAGTELYKP